MTLRTSTIALSILCSISACSVREERQGCPCILTVDLSDASEDKGDVLLSVWSGGEAVSRAELHENIGNTYSCEVPRGAVQISVMQGIERCQTEGRNVIIPEGVDCDRIRIFSDSVDCHGETAHAYAAFVKNWVSVSIDYSYPDENGYPFSFIITGNVCGFDMLTLEPEDGNFMYQAITGQNGLHSCTLNLPRQRTGNGESQLRLSIVRKTDGTEEHTYNLSEIMAEAGFDWEKESLDDFRIGLDYSGRITAMEVRDWEYGMEQEPVI